MKPASRKPIVISFQSICQSPRKLWATSDQAVRRAQPLAPGSARARPMWCWWPVCASLRVLARPLLEAAARRTAAAAPPSGRSSRSRRRYSASVNCQPIRTQSTSPSSQTRLVEANWKASAVDGRGALLEQRLGDRDRGVGAGRGRGAEPGRPGDGAGPAARQRALDPLARDPGLHDRRDREPEHQRPPDLVGHQGGLLEAVDDRAEEISHAPDDTHGGYRPPCALSGRESRYGLEALWQGH